jgi:hypothetical protein
LRTIRKQRKRQSARAEADAKAAQSGLSKDQKTRAAKEAARVKTLFEGHKRD